MVVCDSSATVVVVVFVFTLLVVFAFAVFAAFAFVVFALSLPLQAASDASASAQEQVNRTLFTIRASKPSGNLNFDEPARRNRRATRRSYEPRRTLSNSPINPCAHTRACTMRMQRLCGASFNHTWMETTVARQALALAAPDLLAQV
jgi:hypothetical protein